MGSFFDEIRQVEEDPQVVEPPVKRLKVGGIAWFGILEFLQQCVFECCWLQACIFVSRMRRSSQRRSQEPPSRLLLLLLPSQCILLIQIQRTRYKTQNIARVSLTLLYFACLQSGGHHDTDRSIASSYTMEAPSSSSGSTPITSAFNFVSSATVTTTRTAPPFIPRQNKDFVRTGGGDVWADDSLKDWPEDDYRLFVGDIAKEVIPSLLSSFNFTLFYCTLLLYFTSCNLIFILLYWNTID